MKKYIFIALSILASGCATMFPNEKDLSGAESCKVWKDQVIGTKVIADVGPDEVARYTHSCTIMGMWWCSEHRAYFKDHTSEIMSANSGMIKLETKMGTFENNKFKTDLVVAKVDQPIEFKNGQANFTMEVLGHKQNVDVKYNGKCSVRQAALGTAVVMGK
jgi:hypothetical protein